MSSSCANSTPISKMSGSIRTSKKLNRVLQGHAHSEFISARPHPGLQMPGVWEQVKMIAYGISGSISRTRSEPEHNGGRRDFHHRASFDSSIHVFLAVGANRVNLAASMEDRCHQCIIGAHDLHSSSVSQDHRISVLLATFPDGSFSCLDVSEELS